MSVGENIKTFFQGFLHHGLKAGKAAIQTDGIIGGKAALIKSKEAKELAEAKTNENEQVEVSLEKEVIDTKLETINANQSSSIVAPQKPGEDNTAMVLEEIGKEVGELLEENTAAESTTKGPIGKFLKGVINFFKKAEETMPDIKLEPPVG